MAATRSSFLGSIALIACWAAVYGCATPGSPSEPPPTATGSASEAPPLTFAPDSIVAIELPAVGGGLTVVGENLWDSTDSGLVTVDPRSGSVSEPMAGITNTSFDGTRLWAGGELMLAELDPASGDVLHEYELENNAFYLAATPEAVWATDTDAGLVQRIDPGTGEVLATIATPARPKGTTFGEGALWVACDGANNVVRIDPETNDMTEIGVGDGPHNIAIGGGWVWVTNRHSSTLQKIDPATNTVVATIEDVATSPAVGVVATEDSVWVAYPGGVAEVDPDAAVITRRFSVVGESEPAFYDLKILGAQLWASDTANPTLYGFELP